MNEQQALQDLSYIKEIMRDSRKAFVDNGIGYIVWGIIIVLGLLSTYFFVIYDVEAYGLNWIILVTIGWIFSIVGAKKEREKRKAATFAEKILGAVWFSAGVAMTIIGFLGPISGAIHDVFISPVISIVLGMAYFVSGFVYGAKWITLLSLGWWAGAILMFFWPGMQVFWIMIFMMISLQILPGIILYKQAKAELAQ